MSDTEKDVAQEVVEAKMEEAPPADESSGGGDTNEEPDTAADDNKSPEPSPKKASPQKSSPKKSPAKIPENDDGGEVDEDEESESDEEEQLGLLEKPVVIQEGKRERKKTDRMSFDKVETPDKKKLEIPEGSGTRLGDCPRIEHFLAKTKAADCKPLYRVLYSRVGSASEVKKNIRKFNGFAYEKDSPEYEKKKAQLSKLFTAPLKAICTLLDIHRGGTKEEIVQRIMDFLMKPEDSGKPKPESKRKSKSEGKKRKRKSKSKSTSSSDVVVSEDESEGEKEADNDDDDENEAKSAGSGDEEVEEEKPKPKKRKIETPKKEKKPKGRPKKEKTPKADKKKVPPKKRKVSVSDDSDSDDEPLMKKKSPPTDDDLKDVVKKILDGANLEEVTMKTVLKKVYDKFPDYDLTERKDFIKTTVKEIIS